MLEVFARCSLNARNGVAVAASDVDTTILSALGSPSSMTSRSRWRQGSMDLIRRLEERVRELESQLWFKGTYLPDVADDRDMLVEALRVVRELKKK